MIGNISSLSIYSMNTVSCKVQHIPRVLPFFMHDLCCYGYLQVMFIGAAGAAYRGTATRANNKGK